jgi:hypothetical protein
MTREQPFERRRNKFEDVLKVVLAKLESELFRDRLQ